MSKFTFWAHLRLAGSVTILIGSFWRHPLVLCLGFMLVAVGTVCGVNHLEERVAKLEEGCDKN